ncbi:MAG: nucleotide sugar dehydrogenase [Proteobacteria bacterium]|nr:MAG: nucleotide sugar dehydrogenase [Pseudomonadota bacterium]
MKVAIIGLGYVGIQLAIAVGKRWDTIGYDLDDRKLACYRDGFDPTGEATREQLKSATRLVFTQDPACLADSNVFVVAVPTPIDAARRPDFGPLIEASRLVGGVMTRGSLVVYESTVYPGATEEVCVPVLEQASGLGWMRDFNVGYSPERINPGDKKHTLESIVKIVAADSERARDMLVELYGTVVDAGIHVAPSIRVAEAAKVIENTQRDLNIALVNELAVIFERMGLSTRDILEAAGTKWNFLPFRPGLVGGHCIGVDPYYLTHKAQTLGYHPEVILAGRRINDNMGKFVAEKTVKRMLDAGCEIHGARVNVLGFSFKENCPDMRNTQVIQIVRELRDYGIKVAICDPLAEPEEVFSEFGERLCERESLEACDAMVLAVAHEVFVGDGLDTLTALIRRPGVFVDVKSVFEANEVVDRGLTYWSL